MTIYFVSLFEIDRVYGGPEEGGWYFTAGTPTPLDEYPAGVKPETFFDESDAYARCSFLNDSFCKQLNAGRPPISSVLSRGRYAFHVTTDWPRPFPDRRPHYE